MYSTLKASTASPSARMGCSHFTSALVGPTPATSALSARGAAAGECCANQVQRGPSHRRSGACPRRGRRGTSRCGSSPAPCTLRPSLATGRRSRTRWLERARAQGATAPARARCLRCRCRRHRRRWPTRVPPPSPATPPRAPGAVLRGRGRGATPPPVRTESGAPATGRRAHRGRQLHRRHQLAGKYRAGGVGRRGGGGRRARTVCANCHRVPKGAPAGLVQRADAEVQPRGGGHSVYREFRPLHPRRR